MEVKKTPQKNVKVYVARGLTSPIGRFVFLGRAGKPFLVKKINNFLKKHKKGNVELYKIDSSYSFR